MTRKLAAVLLGCLVLTGCGSTWQDEVRYKVSALDHSTPTEMFKLELAGDAPKGVLEFDSLNQQFVQQFDVGGQIAVGDEIVCTAKQELLGSAQTKSVHTELRGCKKA
jgi:hypothetical protein